ncbi:N-acetyltransferase [Idiomarina sp.]|uniref:GNAT family N-acetyltransferase n=1 Tax=Idiomarina sp. TaxID=1874361 RepID=UPI0026078B53|nr:N-acetyltransferase [Idiomarina sp.]
MASQSYKITCAQLLHLDAVTALEANTYPDDAISKRSFRRFIESGTADFYVLEVNEDVEGYIVVLYRNNTNLARLYALVVSDAYRQKGYGRRLLQKAEALADERHSLFLRTEVAVSNKVAQELLISDGFHSIELREAYFPVSAAQSSDALVLQKLLPRYELGEDAAVGVANRATVFTGTYKNL